MTSEQKQQWDKSGLKEACQRALKLGRTHQETDIQLFLDMLLEIERLESISIGTLAAMERMDQQWNTFVKTFTNPHSPPCAERYWNEAIRIAQLSAKKSQVAGLNIASAEILIRRLERASARKKGGMNG